MPPRGRAEEGTTDHAYQLNETPRASHFWRTEWKVRHTGGTVIVPVAAALTGGSNRTTVERMVAPGTPAQRILVVDDDPLVCDSIGRMLALDGHHVETAISGEQALALFEIGKFDLILTDYGMPVMKSDKLAPAIKALAPNQPLGMFTGYAEAMQPSGQPMPGVDLVISKPFGLDELRQAVTKLLTKH
jgi:CheY-like chemotaxis protein